MDAMVLMTTTHKYLVTMDAMVLMTTTHRYLVTMDAMVLMTTTHKNKPRYKGNCRHLNDD